MNHYDRNDDHQLLPDNHLDPGDVDQHGYCVHGVKHCPECGLYNPLSVIEAGLARAGFNIIGEVQA